MFSLCYPYMITASKGGCVIMRERLSTFFSGRTGTDELNRFLSIMALVLVILGRFVSFLNSLGLVLLIFCLIRMFSKNLYKRSQENRAYLEKRTTFLNWFKKTKRRVLQTKTHHFYKCSSCKAELRVPRGKGKISITCPKCHNVFTKKS